MLYGELDGTVIPRAAIDELAERLGERVTLRLYPERHHLLLHEQGAEQLFAVCRNWPSARRAPAGPELAKSLPQALPRRQAVR